MSFLPRLGQTDGQAGDRAKCHVRAIRSLTPSSPRFSLLSFALAIVSTQLTEFRTIFSQGKDSGVEGFPLRSWSIEIYLLNENGEQVSANLFDKVIYRLHPSFGDRANQSMSTK